MENQLQEEDLGETILSRSSITSNEMKEDYSGIKVVYRVLTSVKNKFSKTSNRYSCGAIIMVLKFLIPFIVRFNIYFTNNGRLLTGNQLSLKNETFRSHNYPIPGEEIYVRDLC